MIFASVTLVSRSPLRLRSRGDGYKRVAALNLFKDRLPQAAVERPPSVAPRQLRAGSEVSRHVLRALENGPLSNHVVDDANS